MPAHGSFTRRGAYWLCAPCWGPLGCFGGRRSPAGQFATYVAVVLKGRATVGFSFVLFCLYLFCCFILFHVDLGVIRKEDQIKGRNRGRRTGRIQNLFTASGIPQMIFSTALGFCPADVIMIKRSQVSASGHGSSVRGTVSMAGKPVTGFRVLSSEQMRISP